VRFPRPLRQGEHANFSIVRSQDVAFDEIVRDECRDSCGLFGITVPIEHATVSIRLPETRQPRSVWHFEDLPDWLAPGATSEASRLQPDGLGFVRFSWTNPTLGLCYGIAWEW